MKIAEPMTMATDYAMGALAAVLAVRLLRAGSASGQMSILLWGGVFVCTALASLLGGASHGFVHVLSPSTNGALWRATLFATGVGSACLLGAAAFAGTSGWLQRILLAVVIVKLVAYVWWMASHNDFIFVIVDYGTALAATMIVAWLSRTGGMAAAVPWLNAGAAVAVVAALIQALKLAPHPQFNHNDLFHVVQMGASYLLYRGGLLLRG
jgi:hypothetical protein